MHGAVVPDIRVEAEEAICAHAVLEETDRLVLLTVQFVNIYAQDEAASGDLGRLVLEEERFIQLELADLEGHFENHLVVMIIQDSQEPLQRLNRSLEVEVEPESAQNLGLKVTKHLLVDVLLFFFGQKPNHARKTGRYRLLQFGGQQDANSCQADYMMLGEV